MHILKLCRTKFDNSATIEISYDEARVLSNALYMLMDRDSDAEAVESEEFHDALRHVKEDINLIATLIKHGRVPDFELKVWASDAQKRKDYDYGPE